VTQATVEKTARPVSSRVIEFRTRMATAASIPPQEPTQQSAPPQPPNWWQKHGTSAQLAAIVVAIVLPLALRAWDHQTANDAELLNARVDSRIENKLNPAVADIKQYLDKQLTPINTKLDDLSTRVGKLEGRFQQLDAGQKSLNARIEKHEAIARLQEDPNEILGTIRNEIHLAQQQNEPLPYRKLVDFKLAIHTFQPTAAEYWRTIADVINYESFLAQLRGNAPDPSRVSHPCEAVTNEGSIHSSNNMIVGYDLENCLVDLDNESFSHLTFVNSVVRYSGGPTHLDNVSFVNCSFVLHLESPVKTRPERELLFALLDAPSQTRVRVTTR